MLWKSYRRHRLKLLRPSPRPFRRNRSAKRKILTLPTLNRRGFLALWAQDRRRKRVRGALPTLLPAPVLRAAYPDLLRWDWSLANPFKWNVWMSMDGGNSYILIEDYWMYGDARQFAPDGGGELYYIVGIDETGREITQHSNIIRPDDAPVPPNLLNGLLAYWAMEALDTTEPDLSGNNNYLQSDASPKVSGLIGLAYDAGGDSGGWWPGMTCIGYPLDGAGDYSFSLWVSGNMPVNGVLLSAGNLFVVNGWNQGGSMQDITVHPFDDGTNSINLGLGWGYNPVGWSHLVFTKSATLFSFYFNGSLVGWADVSAFPYSSMMDQIAIGTGGSGLIDEVGLWTRELSAAEVAWLYNGGAGLPYENF